mgnify:CR=1 FL=1
MKNYNPKKILGLFTVAAAFLVIGCKEETHKTETVKTPEKETIVVTPPPPPAPAPVVIPPPPPAEKPTSISLDKNGIKVKTEKVDVKVGE